MVENFPVTQQEYDYPSENILVSTTDLQGRITHCNHAFEATSGFTYEELIGQPHSLAHHARRQTQSLHVGALQAFARANQRSRGALRQA